MLLIHAGLLLPCLDFLLYRMALHKILGWIREFDPSSQQNCIFRDFSEQIPEEIKVCPPEVRVAGPTFYFAPSS